MIFYSTRVNIEVLFWLTVIIFDFLLHLKKSQQILGLDEYDDFHIEREFCNIIQSPGE